MKHLRTFSATFKKRDHNSRLVDGQTHTVRATHPLHKVHPSKMAIRWTYRCYVDHRERDVIDAWLCGLSKKAKARLLRTLEHLSAKPKDLWERPHASPLGDHIYVIRFTDENRSQWRIYGEHHDDSECFVLCCFGSERNNRYEPPSEQCLSLIHI